MEIALGSLVSVPPVHFGRSQITGTQQLSVSTEACLKPRIWGRARTADSSAFWSRSLVDC